MTSVVYSVISIVIFTDKQPHFSTVSSELTVLGNLNGKQLSEQNSKWVLAKSNGKNNSTGVHPKLLFKSPMCFDSWSKSYSTDVVLSVYKGTSETIVSPTGKGKKKAQDKESFYISFEVGMSGHLQTVCNPAARGSLCGAHIQEHSTWSEQQF